MINLNSRHLKIGDKIIRTKPLSEHEIQFVNYHGIVTKKTKTHIQLKTISGYEPILPIEKWNDGNWARWK